MAEVRSVLFFSRQERIDAIRCSFSRRVVQSLVVLHRSLFPPVFVCVHANGEQRPIVLLLSKFHSDDSSSYRSRSIQLLRFEETEQRQVVLFNCTCIYVYIYIVLCFLIFMYMYTYMYNQIDTKHCIALPAFCFVFHVRYATGGVSKRVRACFMHVKSVALNFDGGKRGNYN